MDSDKSFLISSLSFLTLKRIVLTFIYLFILSLQQTPHIFNFQVVFVEIEFVRCKKMF